MQSFGSDGAGTHQFAGLRDVAVGPDDVLAAADADGFKVKPYGFPGRCAGRTVTVTLAWGQAPTVGSDVVLGTPGADVVDALDGDDVVCGEGGDDVLRGAAGDDTLLGDFPYEQDAIPRPGMGSGYATLGADADNNTLETAFDISDNFSLAEDPDIFDSTEVLHTTVASTGNGQGDYFKVDLAAGTVITLDIDGIADPNVHDSWIRLLDSNGEIVAENDDGGGDPGSATNRDSSLVHSVEETGTYYIVEGRWSPESEEGWEESVPEGSTYELNVSVEFPPEPAEPGTAGSDRLIGGRGNDLLDGGLGKDLLVGGQGEDSFRFSTEIGEGNVDEIRDFTVGEDLILLDSEIFAGLGDAGPLSFGAFHSSAGGMAQDGDHRLVYDTDDGLLAYDADGSGEDDAIVFAELNASLGLSGSDFLIV